MQDTISSEVPVLLEAWGRWARRREGLRLGYARMRQPADMRSGGLSPPPVSDELACWVDSCVAQVEPQRVRDAVVCRYVLGMGVSATARELRCRKASVNDLVADGQHQVGEMLAE